MNSKSSLTQAVLNIIAKHLSSRNGYKGVNYMVRICSEAPYLSFQPITQVFPDKFHRRACDSESIEFHVVYRHFYKDLYAGTNDQGKVMLQPNKLVEGVYLYQSSIDNKSRRWIRIH